MSPAGKPTKKTRTNPICNADGVLIRKDGRPDRRSVTSAMNMQKLHAKWKAERQSEEASAGSNHHNASANNQANATAAPSTNTPPTANEHYNGPSEQLSQGFWAWKKDEKQGWQPIRPILSGPDVNGNYQVVFVEGPNRTTSLPPDWISKDALADHERRERIFREARTRMLRSYHHQKRQAEAKRRQTKR